MNKTVLIIGAIGIVVFGAVLFFFQFTQQTPQEEMVEEMGEMMEESENGMMPEEHSMMGEHTIVFSGNAYSPREITIKKGDTITFRNEGEREMWPASAIHPSHRAYPGSGIEKCETAEKDNIFDACKGLISGAEWSFAFNEVGEWFFHDHLMPEENGKITVQE